jgi:ADP-ribose pyrophosphatase YjhB (NUDIX family)
MEAGESPKEGIAREVFEENRAHAESVSLIGAYEFLRMNQVIHCLTRCRARRDPLSPELIDYRTVGAGEGQVLAGRHRPRARRLAAHAPASSRSTWSCRRQARHRSRRRLSRRTERHGCPERARYPRA